MADQNDPLNVQSVQKFSNVLYTRGRVVAGLRNLRFAMPPSRECKYPILVCELRGEDIVDMRCVPECVQKQDGLSRAAPIQVVELHLVDRSEPSFMRRFVNPLRLCICTVRTHQHNQ